MDARTVVSAYLIAQAVGTAAWWMLLVLEPRSFAWFQPSGLPPNALYGFWLADALLLVAGSIAVAAAVRGNRPWAALALWSLAAAVWYPALYCVGMSVLTDEAWVASAMMVAMAGLTLAAATVLGMPGEQPAAIRIAPMNRPAALGWTFAQVIIFWGAFLWVFPKGIAEAEQRLGFASLEHRGQVGSAIALLAIASLLGIWSGVTMALRGSGTPLPTAASPKLVTAGPYRFVRNPMAVAGIAQGIAVGWLLGSPAVLAYTLAGAFFWHLLVRPVEEQDLQERFGPAYEEYRNRVGLWIPRFLRD